MIVKVAAGRRDKKSSFEDLGEYITSGMEVEAGDITRVSFEHLTRYVAQDSVLDSIGAEVEKTIAIEMHKVFTLKTAGKEMWTVAKENPRAQNPVLHYILSWPEQERPTLDSIMSAARHTLKSIGLAEHQYIIAIHANTDNIHCHIEANRVHPTTFKAQPLEWLHKTLHKASREAEIEHGWLHDNGLYEVVTVNGNKHIVENTTWNDADGSTSRTKKGAVIEAWTGDQSFETWCKGEPAGALKALLKSGGYADWQAIHKALARYGIELREAGGGGWKVFDVASERAGEKSAVVKASQVFRFMKRAELEAALGPFLPAQLEADKPTKTYKRDPEKRIDRRLYRKELRDALRSEYQAHAKEVRARIVVAKASRKTLFAGDEHARIDAIRERRQQRARAIKSDPLLTKAERESALAINIMLAVQAREELRAVIAAERAEVAAMMPVLPAWRAWVATKAVEGNEAAISALRGMVYRERAQEKASGFVLDPTTGELVPKEKPLVEPENAILPGKPTDSDPSIRCVSEAVTWRVTKTGTVNFIFQSGKQAFVDEGSKLTFGGRKDVSDEALLLTLKHAREKWGKEFNLAGGDEVFRLRVLRLASQLNMVVTDPALRSTQQGIDRAQAQAAPAVKPRKIAQPSAESYASVVAMATADRPDVPVRRVNAGDGRAYAGRVVAANGRYVVQDIGPAGLVVHLSKHLDSVPVVGASATIKYVQGRAEVLVKRERSR